MLAVARQARSVLKAKGDTCWGHGSARKNLLQGELVRGAGLGEMLRFLNCNVDKPGYAKPVNKHPECITPWGFLQWHGDGSAIRKLLEVTL